jgi:Flp pilus assembly CpaF family ATPase
MSDGLSKRHAEIDRLIEKVHPYLSDAETFDILINAPRGADRDCWVWVDSADGLIDSGLRLSTVEVENLIRSVASELGRFIDDENPILMGELPWNGARVTAIWKSLSRSGPTLAIRKRSSRLITLDEYFATGALSRGHYDVIEFAIEHDWNIIVAGPNASGKTTLLQAVELRAKEMRPARRLYLIEDVEELRDEALPDNIVRVQPDLKLGVTDGDLVRAALRLRPDGIIVAELLRPDACYQFFNALNTGCAAGSATTVHAKSAAHALVRCEQFIEQVAGITPSPSWIAEAIDLIIYVVRTKTGRLVTEIVRPTGASARGRYDIEPLTNRPISQQRKIA